MNLFAIITPIDVERFESLLKDHPNQPFVRSVVRMLREGAWPWAQLPAPDYPIINDQSQDNAEIVCDPQCSHFFQAECAKEFDARRFSNPFPKLLPGMSCMPVYVINHKGKMRLVTDQTCTRAPLLGMNNLVAKDERAVPLSNLQQFGYHLRALCARATDRRVLVYKCDVKGAYRLIPMHPYWQMLQATKLPDGRYTINRNNVFGGGASGRCRWSLMCLVLWIARCHFACANLCNYVDDVFSADYDTEFLMHPQYHELMPAGQIRFLHCLNVLRIPYDRPKQLWDYTLNVIGFEVNADHLLITMPDIPVKPSSRPSLTSVVSVHPYLLLDVVDPFVTVKRSPVTSTGHLMFTLFCNPAWLPSTSKWVVHIIHIKRCTSITLSSMTFSGFPKTFAIPPASSFWNQLLGASTKHTYTSSLMHVLQVMAYGYLPFTLVSMMIPLLCLTSLSFTMKPLPLSLPSIGFVNGRCRVAITSSSTWTIPTPLTCFSPCVHPAHITLS